MPGIVGLVTKMSRMQAEQELLRMVQALRHESFYRTGIWTDETQGVYVGWIARQDSFSDGMPLRNEGGEVVLVFSGEEFPDPETPRHLREQGHIFEQEGPSYLVHAYEEDRRFLAGLNGRFHGVLYDRRCGATTLFNDRYGMHRIYYHEGVDAFYFAAEAKAILAVRPELRSVDPRSLGEFVACGCVLENKTLFKHIHVLPGGAAWVFREGSLDRKEMYFQPREWEDQAPLERQAFYRKVRDTFSNNVSRYFKGRERVGMSLTGGLDSRIVMAWQKPAPGSLPCHTFGGTFRDCQDVSIARQVARQCHQTHKVIQVGQEFLSRFPYYADRAVYLTDGCLSVIHSPDLYINEQVRQTTPVRMTGNYGSEVLRRSRAFKAVQPAPGLFHPEFLSHVNLACETYAGLLREHPLSFAVFRQAPWHHYGLLALEQTQLSLRSPFLDNDLVRTLFRAPDSALLDNQMSLRLIEDGNPTLLQIRTDRGLGGNSGRLNAAISRRILEFTFKAEYAYDIGMPQWTARIDHFFSFLHFERLFLGRHKFHHFRIWYRDFVSNYIRQILLDQRTLSRPYLNGAFVESMVAGHLEGNFNYTAEIHRTLTLELIHRHFIDSN